MSPDPQNSPTKEVLFISLTEERIKGLETLSNFASNT